MISRPAQCLDTDVNTLVSSAPESNDSPNVIMFDDRKIFLSGALPILEEVMSNYNYRLYIQADNGGRHPGAIKKTSLSSVFSSRRTINLYTVLGICLWWLPCLWLCFSI